MFSILEIMVKLRYNPTKYDLELSLAEILKKICWNFNTHSEKQSRVDCLVFGKWLINFARTKWEPDFIDFNFTIRKIRETDWTFINFDRINVFEPATLYEILRQK